MLATMEKVRLSDDILSEFIQLFEMVRDNQFEIGDRIIELVAMNGGNKAGVINELAGQLNISASALYDYYRTSEKWSEGDRLIYQALDWTIYRNSDPNDPVDRELLDKALDYGWNATRFKREKYPAIIESGSMIRRLISWVRELIEKEDVLSDDKKEFEKIKERLLDMAQRYEK